jgi:tRNA-dihydrouridine synthase 3
LKEDASRKAAWHRAGGEADGGTVNVVTAKQKMDLNRRKGKTPQSDQYLEWLEINSRETKEHFHTSKEVLVQQRPAEPSTDDTTAASISRDENRAMYTEPPFLPSEKRRVYYGPETPILAPLTTQGNLPFRRLCIQSGAALTFSEMAMSIPLLQGQKPEWALLKAHHVETTPPPFAARGSVVQGYDNIKDLKFGAQICATAPWQAIKATEVLHQLCPHLRVIDLNGGCPIDMVYKAGGGSALLDNQAKLEKIIRGMNTVSGEIPITTKIRMGTMTDRPTALKLIERLTLGGHESQEIGFPPCGVAAITLHGRSRQQRYTKLADWEYISECAALIERTKTQAAVVTDTRREGDARHQANGSYSVPYMIGNGDCYSHVDYFEHLEKAKVDSVMIARGALVKPWVFEEIERGQYLDKSASQRLDMIRDYVKYGLDSWGSDEMGVGLTRRFLLEWLSFAHRYVPIGLLDHLPPKLQDRPPAFKGRSDLETLLASENFKDWVKIRYVSLPNRPSLLADQRRSEMFLGPAHQNFKFEPKHKSNSYEIDAEG